MSRRRGGRVVAGALVAGLAVVTLAVGWGGRLAGDARVLRARSLAAPGFGAGGLGRQLRRLGLVHALPPRALPAADLSGFDLQSYAFGRPVEYALEPLSPSEVPRGLAIEPRWLDGEALVVSLLMRNGDLRDFARNPGGRGQEWQRRGYFGYVEAGEHRFGSFVGVRPHGGWARDFPLQHRGFRVYFRNRYGYDRFPLAIFPDRERRPTELVLRHAGGRLPSGEHRYFTNELGLDIARRVGVPAPHTRLAMFYLNGQPMGVRALTEFIQRDYLTAHFGMREPVLVRTKLGPWDRGEQTRIGDPEHHRSLLGRLQARQVDRTWLRANVDVDNLYRWCVAVLFCATGDVFQGGLVRDLGTPGSRWFWIAWDLDESFEIGMGHRADPFRVLISKRRDVRSWALRWLLEEPEERRALLTLASEAVNHRLTDEYLDERLRHYRDQAAALGLSQQARRPLARIRRFLDGRGRWLVAELAGELGDGRSHQVEVRAPAGHGLVIDRHLRTTPYRDTYAGGIAIELAIPPGERREFSYWRIGDRREAAPEVTVEVDRELIIEAVFAAGERSAARRAPGPRLFGELEPGEATAPAA